MTTNASPLGRSEIKRAVAAAQSKYRQGDAAAAVDALAPVLQEIGQAVAQTVVHPLRSPEDWEDLGPTLIRQWRVAIKKWAADNFKGELPGRRAIRETAKDFVARAVGQALLDPGALYRGGAAWHVLRTLSLQVFGHYVHPVYNVATATESVVVAIWVQETLNRGVPNSLFTPFTWVPGWDGESLDAALDTLTLQSVRYRSGPLEHLLPRQGMKNLLASVGQHPTLVMNYVRQKYPSDVADRFADVLEASNCLPQTSEEPALSANDLVKIIENCGWTDALPVVYAEVNVRALLSLDPRYPIDLSLDNGQGHCRGLHDPLYGCGYVDIFKGPAVMPPMSLGFAGQQGLGRDIHMYHDWVRKARSRLRCTPRALATDARSTKALSLRIQALALLQRAQQLDGLHPHLIHHGYKHGHAGYLVWAPGSELSQEAATNVLEGLYDQENESLDIESAITLDEIAGVDTTKRIADNDDADDTPFPPEYQSAVDRVGDGTLVTTREDHGFTANPAESAEGLRSAIRRSVIKGTMANAVMDACRSVIRIAAFAHPGPRKGSWGNIRLNWNDEPERVAGYTAVAEPCTVNRSAS